jgi:hypothetical protein
MVLGTARFPGSAALISIRAQRAVADISNALGGNPYSVK